MRREGSAFQGLGAVVLKELSDHLSSVRMRVLEWLVVLVAIAALWGAIQQIKETTALGAAYLAGLQAGFFPEPDRFADRWRLDRRFTPQMDATTRERKLAGWSSAIRRLLA